MCFSLLSMFSVGFLIVWSPYVFVSYYIVLGNPRNLDPILSRSASLLAKSQVIWNTVIYVFAADDFREKAKSFMTSQRNCTEITMPRRINNGQPGGMLEMYEVALLETTV